MRWRITWHNWVNIKEYISLRFFSVGFAWCSSRITKQSNKQTNTILMHQQLNLAYKVYIKRMLILVIIVGTWLGFLFQEWREILIPACVKVFHIHLNLPSANINLPHEKKKLIGVLWAAWNSYLGNHFIHINVILLSPDQSYFQQVVTCHLHIPGF